MERVNAVFLQDFLLDLRAALLDKLPPRGPVREWRYVLSLHYLLWGFHELERGILVQVHARCNDPARLGAEDGTLTLRADKGALVLMVHRSRHDDFLALRGLQCPSADGGQGSASLIRYEPAHLAGQQVRVEQVAVTNVYVVGRLRSLELATCARTRTGRRLGEHGAVRGGAHYARLLLPIVHIE